MSDYWRKKFQTDSFINLIHIFIFIGLKTKNNEKNNNLIIIYLLYVHNFFNNYIIFYWFIISYFLYNLYIFKNLLILNIKQIFDTFIMNFSLI